MRENMYKRAAVFAAALVAAAAFAGPANAATLPGLPSWTGTIPWWTHLPQPWKPPTPTPPNGGGTGNAASFSGTYNGSGGSRSYRGYVPSTYKQGTAVPL